MSKARRSSSELGDQDFATKYSRWTGRPQRQLKPAKQDPSFVDSTLVLSDDDDADEEHSDEDSIPVARPRKRVKRSPSPPLSAVESDAEPVSDDEDHAPPPTQSPVRSEGAMQITISNMTINVPEGHRGPILLQLDLTPHIPSTQPKSTEVAKTTSVTSRTKQSTRRSRLCAVSHESTPPSTLQSTAGKSIWRGFLDLPPELRNTIYERVLTTSKRLNFDTPHNFSLTAALLRTNRQIYTESRPYLYTSNHFLFARTTKRHGSYWSASWNEIGFKAVRRFLKIIGPVNTGLIRHATLLLEDAIPCLNPALLSAEDRRFVHDDVLMSCLRHLARFGKLERLGLHFRGRRRVERADLRFLEHLTRIQADDVRFVSDPKAGYPAESKQEYAVEKLCLAAMSRKRKVFAS